MTRDTPFPYPPAGECVFVVAALTFVIGSCCFLPQVNQTKAGDLLFVGGSGIYLAKSLQTMHHVWKEHKWKALGGKRHISAEFFENVMYFISALIFTAGCVLFYPDIYDVYGEKEREERKHEGEEVGSWLFIIGSLGFVTASFANSVLLSKGKVYKVIPGRYGARVYNMAFAALLCSQLGGCLFVSGSFLYRPSLSSHCQEIQDKREAFHAAAAIFKDTAGVDVDPYGTDYGKMVAFILANRTVLTKEIVNKLIPTFAGTCESTQLEGTRLYIIGSVFYLVQAVLYWFMALFRRKAEIKAKLESDTDDLDDVRSMESDGSDAGDSDDSTYEGSPTTGARASRGSDDY